MSDSVEVNQPYSDSGFDQEKFKQVLHYIISKTESFPNVGKKVIYKLLYFIDFNYYELKEEKLTGEVYSKLEHGPAPRHFSASVDELKNDGLIQERNVPYHKYTQIKYNSLENPDLSLLNANELRHLDETLCRYASMNGSQIEALSHNDITWNATEINENLNYELVFYRSSDMSVREYCNE